MLSVFQTHQESEETDVVSLSFSEEIRVNYFFEMNCVVEKLNIPLINLHA